MLSPPKKLRSSGYLYFLNNSLFVILMLLCTFILSMSACSQHLYLSNSADESCNPKKHPGIQSQPKWKAFFEKEETLEACLQVTWFAQKTKSITQQVQVKKGKIFGYDKNKGTYDRSVEFQVPNDSDTVKRLYRLFIFHPEVKENERSNRCNKDIQDYNFDCFLEKNQKYCWMYMEFRPGTGTKKDESLVIDNQPSLQCKLYVPTTPSPELTEEALPQEPIQPQPEPKFESASEPSIDAAESSESIESAPEPSVEPQPEEPLAKEPTSEPTPEARPEPQPEPTAERTPEPPPCSSMIEVCNGRDDNCDGKTDESFPDKGKACSSSQKGLCKAGVFECTKGKKVCKPKATPVSEVCDNKDNDCDGSIDEGLTRPCYNGSASTKGVGICKSGTQRCQKGQWSSTCTGQTLPLANESCNGKDDDCDGQTDEGYQLGTACSVGAHNCKRTGKRICDGGRATCSVKPGTPTPELCDNKDNDCNGKIDDNIKPRSCYSGTPGTEKNKPCKAGSQGCQAGIWEPCAGSVTPQPEKCDNIDNNCNGKVDENFNVGTACLAGTGSCQRQGVNQCKNGNVACNATPGKPSLEKCDGQDNDCDGNVDEGCPWAVSAGGNNARFVYASLTHSGNIYIGGHFRGRLTLGSTTLNSKGDYDLFIARFDTTGKLIWAHSRGSGGKDHVFGLTKDGKGNICATGTFAGTVGFLPSTSLRSKGGQDIYVGCFNTKGQWLWASSIGTSGNDYAHGIGSDMNGGLYVTGYYGGTFTLGTRQYRSRGGSDLLVAKVDTKGQWLWFRRMGGTGTDYGRAIAVDGSGNVYVTGFFHGTASFSGNTLLKMTAYTGGGEDTFIAKLDSNGKWLWALPSPGPSTGYAYGITISPGGNPIICGNFADKISFASTTLTSKGGFDIFVAEAKRSGTWNWATRLGGTGNDRARSVVSGLKGDFAITGYYDKSITIASKTLKAKSETDVLVATLSKTGVPKTAFSGGGLRHDEGLHISRLGKSLYIVGTHGASATFGNQSFSPATGIFVWKFDITTW